MNENKKNEIYLWLDVSVTKGTLLENHKEMRSQFRKIASSYTNLQVHDGDLDPNPYKDILLIPNQKEVFSNYCMAKTTPQFENELISLKSDLSKEPSLKDRIIGPSSDSNDIKKYVDNFYLHDLVKKFPGAIR